MKFSVNRMCWIASCLFIKSYLFLWEAEIRTKKVTSNYHLCCFSCEICAHKTYFYFHECNPYQNMRIRTHDDLLWTNTNTCQFRMAMTFLLVIIYKFYSIQFGNLHHIRVNTNWIRVYWSFRFPVAQLWKRIKIQPFKMYATLRLWWNFICCDSNAKCLTFS